MYANVCNMLCTHNALRINQSSRSLGVASCVSEFSPKYYIYVCIYVCMHVSVCIYEGMYVCICMYVCMYLYINLCMHVCMYACMCPYVQVEMSTQCHLECSMH